MRLQLARLAAFLLAALFMSSMARAEVPPPPPLRQVTSAEPWSAATTSRRPWPKVSSYPDAPMSWEEQRSRPRRASPWSPVTREITAAAPVTFSFDCETDGVGVSGAGHAGLVVYVKLTNGLQLATELRADRNERSVGGM